MAISVSLTLTGCASVPGSRVAAGTAVPEKTYRYVRPKVNFERQAVFVPKKEPFAWPVRGNVIAVYGAKVGRVRNKGIDIRADEGTDVKASRSGRVVYRDSKFRGFGKTLVVDHGDGYGTVYSYNSEILARMGDVVGRDTVIAKTGRTGRAAEPSLHFEIRKDGVPQDPAGYLPG